MQKTTQTLKLSKNKQNNKQIFIFRLGPIGDIVNVIPLIKLLRASCAELEIIYICESLYFPIVSRISEIDKIHICEIDRDLQSDESIRKMADELKNLYSASSNSEFILLHLHKPFLKLAQEVGTERVFLYKNSNFWFSNLPLWKRFAKTYSKNLDSDLLNEKNLLPLFQIKDTEKIKGRLSDNGIDLNKKLIALVPGAGKNLPHKALPIEHWVELIKFLLENSKQQISICLIGSDREKDLIKNILHNLKIENFYSSHIHDLSGKFELNELIDLFSLFSVCVGADSGAVHIASAMGVKTICLFGPTSSIKHRPINASIVEEKCFVLCKFLKKCVQKKSKSCMHKINPEAIGTMVLQFLEREVTKKIN